MKLSAMLAFLLFMLGGLQCTYGQATADKVFSEPDEIRFANPQEVTKAAKNVFSASEQLALCQRGQGFIMFECRIDTAGRIEAITNTKLYQAAQSLPTSLLNKMKESVHQNVVFYVPKAYKTPKMSPLRQASFTIPLRSYCK
ncbi:hypothetical protein [Hymenobacter norwichensis]|uniref:hypothetical protein n=1 Tax=Hymenobacter norwichensis TaxID=223903 RepID=UPI0003B6AF53|nr:hypothetical protein [Hymenobacter norwichensis]